LDLLLPAEGGGWWRMAAGGTLPAAGRSTQFQHGGSAFREVWDEHEAYHWQEGNDLRCCDCGALWSSKVRYCLGDWCGGPVEPVDGSWHVAWRFLNSADPEQLHTEMPVFAGGRYKRDDVEVVRVPGRRQPRPSLR